MLSVRKLLVFGTFILALNLVLGGEALEDLKGLPPPDVHSPYYLVKLANYELSLANVLFEFDRDLRQQSQPPVALAHAMKRHDPSLPWIPGDKKPSPRSRLPNEIAEVLHGYLQNYRRDILAVQAYSNYNLTKNFGLEIAQNPLLSYKMVYRFVFDLQAIHKAFLKFGDLMPAGPVKKYFSSKLMVSTWPTNKALADSINAILRIQIVYDQDAKKLANGTILEIDTGVTLGFRELVRIGSYAHDTKQYTLAISWLELAIEELNTEETLEEVIKSDIQNYLGDVYAEHDRGWDQKREWEYYYFNQKLIENGTLLNFSERVPLRKLNLSADSRKENHLSFTSWSLCSGENHQTETEKSKLHCWYETNSHPVLLLGPFKTELLSKSPRIIQIYDMISETTIANMVAMAIPTLARSRIIEPNKTGDAVDVESPIRTSVEGRVPDEPFTGLTGLIESVTGLKVAGQFASEEYAVASYAVGGHYDCHLDATLDPDIYELFTGRSGNRIATIMFYLENTQKGGFTAFPLAGVAAKPIKGSAVFWYNLKRSGKSDLDTFHCACPVVKGFKIMWDWSQDYLNQVDKSKRAISEKTLWLEHGRKILNLHHL